MFRKEVSYLLIVVGLAMGINFHQEDCLYVEATSLEIQGGIGNKDESSSFTKESFISEKEERLAEPKEDEIFLQRMPAFGESETFLFLLGTVLFICTYLVKKRDRE